jgi:hypothetical protein
VVVSGIFGSKPSQATTPVRLNGIGINQSVYGNAVPLLYGTSRLTITLIDYVDFTSTAQTQSGGKGGGSGTTTGFTYTASFIAALCEGPIASISTVYLDQSQTTLAAQNLTLFSGGAAQPIWSYMVNNHPDHALPYDHIAYVAAPNFKLGSSAGLPNLTFETTGLLPFGGGIIDAEPSAIITDYCTDPNHGVGFPFLAPLTGTNSYQQYCVAMGFFISPAETTQRQAQDFIKEILQVTNSQAVWTAATGLRIIPYQDQPVSAKGASYTPNLTPIYSFNDSDYIYESGQPPVQRSIIPANETFNVWRVEFLDRSNQYNTAIQEFRDEVDVAANGLRVNTTVSLHSITMAPVAQLVAALQCMRNINIRSTFTFKVRADYSLLEPMDLVALTDSIGGIVNQLVRITEVSDDENDVFTITAEEMMVGPASAPAYDTQSAASFAANYSADPGNVATPYIFTIPPLLVGPNGGYEIGIAVAGTSGMWAGADVWASLDDVSYDHVGIIAGPARVGSTLGPLPASTDPDTADSVSVQLNPNTPMVLNSGTRADADNLRTLFILGGEIMSYQNATPLGENAFSLSYFRRGAYGSPNSAHAAGAPFAALDKAIFRMPFDPGLSGQPVWFKFASFNLYGGGHQTLDQVTAYQGFFQGQNAGQLLPNGDTPLIARNWCVNVGTRIYKNPTGTTGWDSDCYSKDAFAGACTLRFTASQTNADFMLGIDTNPTADENYTSINYAWNPSADGNAYIRTNGSLVFSTGPYTTSTKFEIRYDGKYVTFYRDSVQWWTVQAPGQVFYLDSSFYAPGASADNVYFGALNPANSSPFYPTGQCTISDEHAQKAGGVTAWDSSVYSLEGYPACHVMWKANQTTASLLIGLTDTPAKSRDGTNVKFGFQLNADGTWREFIGGAIGGKSGTYDLTTVFSITYDGTTVLPAINGVSIDPHADFTTLNRIYFMDSSFFTPGGGVNSLQFGPTTTLKLTGTTQIGANAATLTYSSVSNSYNPHPVTIPANSTNFEDSLVALNAPNFQCSVIVTAIMTAAQANGLFADTTIEFQYQDAYAPGGGISFLGPLQSSPIRIPLPVIPYTSGALTGTQLVARAIFDHEPYTGGSPVTVPSIEVCSGTAYLSIINNTGAGVPINIGYITLTVEYIIR